MRILVSLLLWGITSISFAQVYDIALNFPGENITGAIDLSPPVTGPVIASEITAWSFTFPDMGTFSGSSPYYCGTPCALTVSGNQLLFNPSNPGGGNMSFGSGLINFVADDSQTGQSEFTFDTPYQAWKLPGGVIGTLEAPEIDPATAVGALTFLAMLLTIGIRRRLTP